MGESKRKYVLSQKQDRFHSCHWPGCKEQVPPAMWGCKSHWFRLPKRLRDRIWATYRPGQEKTLNPSSEYLAAADEVERWIKSQTSHNDALATMARTIEVRGRGLDYLPEEQPCPHCQAVQYGASHAVAETPKPGDYAICGSCAGIQQFDENLRFVAVTDAMVAAMPEEDQAELREHQAVMRAHKLDPGGREKLDA